MMRAGSGVVMITMVSSGFRVLEIGIDEVIAAALRSIHDRDVVASLTNPSANFEIARQSRALRSS
jgi:hypothetical protein